MNTSSWRKAVDLIAQGTQANQQVQAAATADSSQLESLPLSTLSANDSSPPQVNYDTEQPLAASTPRATLTLTPETQATDTYRQIIPGMSERLYPTLIADGLLTTPAVDNCSTLQKQITSEIDKYLQEAVKEMIITMMGSAWLPIHQAHNKKLTSYNRMTMQVVMKKTMK